jgi:transposase
MIVIGTDAHKVTHTCGAVEGGTGQLAGELTASARRDGLEELLAWGRSLDSDRIWAIEDCRHVSGAFERFLIEHGERVVRVAPRLMGESRKGERTRGKSDPLDAEAMEIKLLADHREQLVRSRTEEQCTLRWHLHQLWPELELPAGCLDRMVWLDKVARKLARADQDARVRVCRDLVRSIRERSKRAAELEREIAALVRAKAPELLDVPGCGSLTAARILAETAGVERFTTDAKLARLAGVAPIPASSGNKQRHRLDRGGNRRLNCAFHRIAVTQGRVHGPAREFLARKQAEGKSRIEALRCLKRHLARAVWQALRAARDRAPLNSPSPLIDSPNLRPATGLALT